MNNEIHEEVSFRVGVGYDSHRLVEGRPLVLGGVVIPFEMGLQGHSDADVVLHAISDAICGAAGLPDIGRMFPDTDEEWRGADSRQLLRRIMSRATEAGWEIENIDAVLVAQRPKIAPYIEVMRQSTAEALETTTERVNIRGKTAEGLGPVGEGAGMEAHAVCLLRRQASRHDA
jgi:2-C-methyl-D-erythritol 2,4-cyclodiphosphate synthase